MKQLQKHLFDQKNAHTFNHIQPNHNWKQTEATHSAASNTKHPQSSWHIEGAYSHVKDQVKADTAPCGRETNTLSLFLATSLWTSRWIRKTYSLLTAWSVPYTSETLQRYNLERRVNRILPTTEAWTSFLVDT